MDTNTQNYLTSPQSTAAIQGNLNNSGMLDSGAYSSTLASLMSQGALQNQNNVLQGITVPAEQNLLGTLSSPYQQTVANSNSNLQGFGTQQNNVSDFQMQSALGQMLEQMGQPSTAMNDIGMASGAANAFGGTAKGSAALSQATWICTAMKRAGVLSEAEVYSIHKHLYRAFWKRPLKFLEYLILGKLVVWRAQACHTDWRLWKSDFYDNVMAEPDPVKAVNLYEEAFWSLCRNVQRREAHAS
jgi:hypothetical protein